MKIITILCILPFIILLSNATNAQDLSLKVGKFYYFKTSITLNTCNNVGVLDSTSNNIEGNWKFTIVKTVNNSGYVISIAHFPSGYKNQTALNLKFHEAADGTPIYHYLPQSEVKEHVYFTLSFFSYGAISAPFKARFGGGDGSERRYFDLTSNISLGLSVGGGFQTPGDVKHHILLSASITAIPVSSINTQNFVNSSTTITSLSPAISYIHQQKNIQVGAFFGFDILTGEVGTKWLYRNSPWVGVGIGLNLFSPNINEQSK